MKCWSARIEATENAMDLLLLTREFLDNWDPAELALLPPQARPDRIKGVDDLDYWHQRLVECFCSARLRDDEFDKVREMAQFFAFALQRAEHLDAVVPIPGHEAARLFSERSVPKLFTSAMTGVGER